MIRTTRPTVWCSHREHKGSDISCGASISKETQSEMDSKTLHPPPPVLQVCSEVMAAACDRGEQNTPGTL